MNKRGEMHPLDLPAAYDELNQAEKDAVTYWIEHAIGKAAKYADRTSYGIKHDFEREGFYLTNGQFKGAMLAAGYQPEDAQELNWTFKIKPYKENRRPSDDAGWFRIGRDEPTQQEFARLLKLVQEAEEKETIMRSDDAEKRVETILSTLPPAHEWKGRDIYQYIRRCAELLRVNPATLNLAVGFVSDRTLTDSAELTKDLLLILEYLRTGDED